MKHLTTAGRILFALPFGIMGLNHFIMYNYLVGIASTFIPGGGWTVIIAGLALIAACISIIVKKFIQLSCLCSQYYCSSLSLPYIFPHFLMQIRRNLILLFSDCSRIWRSWGLLCSLQEFTGIKKPKVKIQNAEVKS